MPLESQDILVMFLSFGVLLLCARALGELAQRFNQPAVVGELLVGILLGPTVLGALAPRVAAYLFPSQGPVASFFSAFVLLAVVLFLLVAGMEVDLSTIWRQGRAALWVSLAGIIIPGAIGYAAARAFPELLGREPGANPVVFPLFLAAALAISALPVIAKTMMDLDLYRSDLGMVVIASAVFNDLAGWLAFALVLSLMGVSAAHSYGIGATIGLTLAFTAFMLTIGRVLVHRMLPWVQAHTTWPGGVLGFALSLALLGAAVTDWIGIHAIFGSFLVGIAVGDSSHLRQQTRMTILQFVSFIFAPIFFASIGLRIDFIAHFDGLLTVAVLVIACLGKIVGCTLGARVGRIPLREAIAIGFAMNARGAMEIVLGLLALQYGVIGERLFVALVVMAIVTSLMSGPMMRLVLRQERPRRLTDYLASRSFLPNLQAENRWDAIRELVQTAVPAELDVRAVEAAVMAREHLMSTGLGSQIAVPHARIQGLAGPVVAVGLSRSGVDFDAPDGDPAHLVFLLLTPADDHGAQLEILAEVARRFSRADTREQALRVGSYTEFLAVLKTQGPERAG